MVKKNDTHDDTVARIKDEAYDTDLGFAEFADADDLYASNEFNAALRAILNLPTANTLPARIKHAELSELPKLMGEAVHTALVTEQLRKLLVDRVERHAQYEAGRISHPLGNPVGRVTLGGGITAAAYTPAGKQLLDQLLSGQALGIHAGKVQS